SPFPLLLLPPPPLASLYPSTTLFRSVAVGVIVADEQALDVPAVQHRGEHARVHGPGALLLVPLPLDPVLGHGALVIGVGAGIHGDRKSTRLNSSHVSISHAASCLKKK